MDSNNNSTVIFESTFLSADRFISQCCIWLLSVEFPFLIEVTFLNYPEKLCFEIIIKC